MLWQTSEVRRPARGGERRPYGDRGPDEPPTVAIIESSPEDLRCGDKTFAASRDGSSGILWNAPGLGF